MDKYSEAGVGDCGAATFTGSPCAYQLSFQLLFLTVSSVTTLSADVCTTSAATRFNGELLLDAQDEAQRKRWEE